MGQIFAVKSHIVLSGCYDVGSLGETALLDMEVLGGRVSPRHKSTPIVVSYHSALSPLTKLEMEHNKKRKRSLLILFGQR